jgi:hypothetical protein
MDPSCPGAPDKSCPVIHAGKRCTDPSQKVDSKKNGENAFPGPGTIFVADDEKTASFCTNLTDPKASGSQIFGPVPKNMPGPVDFETDMPVLPPVGEDDPDMAHGGRKSRQDLIGQGILITSVGGLIHRGLPYSFLLTDRFRMGAMLRQPLPYDRRIHGLFGPRTISLELENKNPEKPPGKKNLQKGTFSGQFRPDGPFCQIVPEKRGPGTVTP